MTALELVTLLPLLARTAGSPGGHDQLKLMDLSLQAFRARTHFTQ
jgi:hypothetical protein